MYKKMLLLLVIYAVFVGTSMAKEPVLIKEISAGPASSPVSAAPTTASSAISIGPGPAPQSAIAASLIEADLQPAVSVECFAGGELEEYLARMGLLPVKHIHVRLYNSGNGPSGSGQGQIYFFDLLQNKSTRFDFNIDPLDPNEWSPEYSYYCKGPFIIRKDAEITVNIQFCPKSVCYPRETKKIGITEKAVCS